MKFTVSFTTDLFQQRDISERAELISSVFKGNVSDLELDILMCKTHLSLKTTVNHKDL